MDPGSQGQKRKTKKAKQKEKHRKKAQQYQREESEVLAEKSEEEGDEVDLPFSLERAKNRDNLPPPISIQSQDEYICRTARTALLLPFKWSDPTTADLGQWINEMLKRKIITEDETTISLYEENKILPDAVADLDPHFSKTLGWNESIQKVDENEFELYDSGHDVLVDEVCRRVIVQPEAMKTIFPSPGLVANQSGQPIQQMIKLEEIEIVGFPLGTAVLKFVVNWITPSNCLTLDEFRTWLYLSKFRHKVEAFEGWLLDCEPTNEDATAEQVNVFGSRLCKALYQKIPVSLTAIGNWLLMASQDSAEKPPQRLGRFAKRCYHHTVVVIDRKPLPALLKEYLFHLKRAYGQKNRPPPLTMGDERPATDRILRPRSNRYIGMSREGTVSFSWPSKNQEQEDYEVRKWHKVFLGIYLILAIQIQGEKAMLLELSNLSAHAGSLLKKFSTGGKVEENLSGMSKLRTELGSLAALMTRYTLQMSSDDCGGLSEYVEFFTAQRSIFGIRSQRNELREEIQDVLALVESSYLEEQRKFSELTTFYRKQEKRQSKLRDEKIASSQARFQNTVAVVSIFTLPPMILGSLFGMNLTDLPVQVPFFSALAVTLSISVLLLIIFTLIMWKTSKNAPLPPPTTLGQRISLSLDGDRSLYHERFSIDPYVFPATTEHKDDVGSRGIVDRQRDLSTYV